MKPSQRHAHDSNLMVQFRNAYVELVNNAHAVPQGLTMAVLEAAPGLGQERWGQLYSATSTAAGAAATAYRKYGGTFTLRNSAYITNYVDPVANW